MTNYTKQETISIITSCAAMYEENLNGRQLLLILKDKHNHFSSMELSFYSYNFLHLTGIRLNEGLTAADFYNRCLNHKLSQNDFSFALDGTTQLKLEILPLLMSKNISAKMVGDFDSYNPKLYTEKLAGGVKACLGFVRNENGEYIPNTALNVDIRTVIKFSKQVIATYRKKKDEPFYQELVYKSKKIDWDTVVFPKEYSYLFKPNNNQL